MFAGSEEQDFDAESGDDIMVQGESVIRNEGMFGFDWAIFKGVARDAYADMNVPIFTTEQADILRNRFDKVEALSGWRHNDTLIGDGRLFGAAAPGAIVGTTEGVFFNDGLDQAGLNRINGLSQIVSVGPTGFFESGNILLGGAGSDVLKGNAGDDILDGDRWLNVRIRITAPGQENSIVNEIASVDSMAHVFSASELTPATASWAGKSLFELMVNRVVTPSQLHIVREILTEGAASGDRDVAVFNDVRANYLVTRKEDGSLRVEHATVTVGAIDPATGRALVSDGVDTLRNIEVLRFADGDFALTPPELRLNGFDSATVADNFNVASYTNSTGDRAWGSGWVEADDDGSATAGAGQIRITGGVLQFDQGNGAAIQRTINLAGASFDADPNNLDAGEAVRVLYSADGVTFNQLDVISRGPSI